MAFWLAQSVPIALVNQFGIEMAKQGPRLVVNVPYDPLIIFDIHGKDFLKLNFHQGRERDYDVIEARAMNFLRDSQKGNLTQKNPN